MSDSDDSDEDKYKQNRKSNNNSGNKGIKASTNVPRTLNELLMKALEEAANPGDGDEQPEVLEDPNISSDRRGSKMDEDEPESKLRKSEQAERNRLIEEEERKQAELNFDHDALLPFQSMKERAKYIPLRLSYDERKSLRLVNSAINVSDYTTAVDVSFKNKARRHHIQLQHIVAFLTGLIAATNYDRGQEVLSDRNFGTYQDVIQNMLEIARRFQNFEYICHIVECYNCMNVCLDIRLRIPKKCDQNTAS